MAGAWKDPAAAEPPAIPIASYRLQLSAGFTFDSLSRIAPYLRALGVSHVYASPWLKARAGSSHGYDIIDHNAFSAELGGADAFEHMALILKRQGLGHILDFVPNHMGVGGADNAWWLDVLEWGQRSSYASYFDIDWEPINPRLAGKVLLPFLGDHYGRVLESGALRPRFDAGTGRFDVWYGPHRFPIAAEDYASLLRDAGRLVDGSAGPAAFLLEIAIGFDELLAKSGREGADELREEVRKLRLRLAEAALADPGIVTLLAQSLASLAGSAGDAQSFEALHSLLERQHYRLAFWGVAADEVNYRRFFTINDLACIRMQTPGLFEAAHGLVRRLLAEGKLQGLRIDHVDGQFDPADYCRRLRALALELSDRPDPPYTVVEKILARHERLPEDWQVHGTTGYDFLNQLTGLLVDGRGAAAMTRTYHRFIGREVDYDDLVFETKMLVMNDVLGGELGVLARELDRISERHWLTRDYTLEGLRSALMTVIACYPIYRTYVATAGPSPVDRRHIAWAIGQARKRWGRSGRGILDFLERILSGEIDPAEADGRRADVLRFAIRVQQYTGPVMAKGVEDTAFYRYHRLISLSEVGGDPRQFGNTIAAFHHLNQERAGRWPNAMLATATHDTKRGEDARARINVLSEIPEEWRRRVLRWASLNRRKKSEIDGRIAPGGNDEYLLYQTLIGAWPASVTDAPLADFVDRIQAYMLKAVREARWRSSWANPHEEYERALQRFIAQILDPGAGRLFLKDFLPFQARVARVGMLASLVQLTLKLTCPGMPDLYQGSEFWDLSLVDPDNRRPVDFDARIEALAALADGERDESAAGQRMNALREQWQDGRIKLHLLWRLLRLRGTLPDVFARGDYQPCAAEGPMAEHVCAFARGHGETRMVVAVARHLAPYLGPLTTLPEPASWSGTILHLPTAPDMLADVLTGQALGAANGILLTGQLFSVLPVAVLVSQADLPRPAA